MFNLQGSEIIVILLLALVVLGPEKLPDAIRRFSRTYAELKKMGNGFQSELKSALDEPMREMRETANAVRDAADPKKIEAQADAERRLADETSDDDSWIDAPHLQSPDEHSNGADATSATNASNVRDWTPGRRRSWVGRSGVTSSRSTARCAIDW